MVDGLRFSLRMSSDLKARLEKYALEVGETQSRVVREAMAEFLASRSKKEQKHGELGMTKRIGMLEAMPDGVMLIARIDNIIQNQIGELRKRNWLVATDYDHFIRLVEENKKAVQTYDEGEWLASKLDTLIEKLRKEKRQCQSWANRKTAGCESESNAS